ncbi:MAG: type II toxin-antitoxin system HicB family antitoxin [Gammaproteobacteria bacterium]|nr:type II toxin-antitoxin system HicB family antitoxin [Gammaproteobacteria bacterium]
MKYYYALFKKTPDCIEVEFPDLAGCVTYAKDWEDALRQARDVLAGWLAHAEPQFIKEPSKHDELQHLEGELVPIFINENTIVAYKKLKRFNVIFPAEILDKIDSFRKKNGLKRSTLLQKAVVEYLHHHQ